MSDGFPYPDETEPTNFAYKGGANPTPEAVGELLTEAQREALLGDMEPNGEIFVWHLTTARNLVKLGLIQQAHDRYTRLTPLGRALRQQLQGQANG